MVKVSTPNELLAKIVRKKNAGRGEEAAAAEEEEEEEEEVADKA